MLQDVSVARFDSFDRAMEGCMFGTASLQVSQCSPSFLPNGYFLECGVFGNFWPVLSNRNLGTAMDAIRCKRHGFVNAKMAVAEALRCDAFFARWFLEEIRNIFVFFTED